MPNFRISRRAALTSAAALAASAALPTRFAIAQAKPLKVGLMLPYPGTFASSARTSTSRSRCMLAEKGGKLGGREIQFVKLDDESKPENSGRRTPTAWSSATMSTC